MKKIILLLALIPLFVHCEKEYVQTYWWVENQTGDDLEITAPPPFYFYGDPTFGLSYVTSIYSSTYYLADQPRLEFDTFIYKGWRSWSEENVYFEVKLGDKTKRWGLVDKNSPGKQFFNQKSWTHTPKHNRERKETLDAWTFAITAEDFQ